MRITFSCSAFVEPITSNSFARSQPQANGTIATLSVDSRTRIVALRAVEGEAVSLAANLRPLARW